MFESDGRVVVSGTGGAGGRETVWVVVCIESGIGVAMTDLSGGDAEWEFGSWTGTELNFGLGSRTGVEVDFRPGFWTRTELEFGLEFWIGIVPQFVLG